MKKVLLIIALLMVVITPALAADNLPGVKKQQVEEDFILPNIFIFPDTSDTIEEVTSPETDTPAEIVPETQINTRYDDSSVVRYELSQEWEDVVELTDVQNKTFNLNTQYNAVLPLSNSLTDKLMKKSVMPATYRREEFNIMPVNTNQTETFGNFKFGTLYKSGIDTSQLEYNAGLFTRYERSRFAISTAYQKNQMTTYGLTTDNFYLAPEFKLNDAISVSNVFKADTTRNRRSSELVLRIKPFANRGNDRVNLEFGAGQTYDENNALFKTQFRFNTNIKL